MWRLSSTFVSLNKNGCCFGFFFNSLIFNPFKLKKSTVDWRFCSCSLWSWEIKIWCSSFFGIWCAPQSVDDFFSCWEHFPIVSSPWWVIPPPHCTKAVMISTFWVHSQVLLLTRKKIAFFFFLVRGWKNKGTAHKLRSQSATAYELRGNGPTLPCAHRGQLVFCGRVWG